YSLSLLSYSSTQIVFIYESSSCASKVSNICQLTSLVALAHVYIQSNVSGSAAKAISSDPLSVGVDSESVFESLFPPADELLQLMSTITVITLIIKNA